MCSYKKECAKGHEVCDFLCIVMPERSVDLVDYSGMSFARFMAAKAYLPLWGEPPNSDIAPFVDALGI